MYPGSWACEEKGNKKVKGPGPRFQSGYLPRRLLQGKQGDLARMSCPCLLVIISTRCQGPGVLTHMALVPKGFRFSSPLFLKRPFRHDAGSSTPELLFTTCRLENQDQYRIPDFGIYQGPGPCTLPAA